MGRLISKQAEAQITSAVAAEATKGILSLVGRLFRGKNKGLEAEVKKAAKSVVAKEVKKVEAKLVKEYAEKLKKAIAKIKKKGKR